MIVAGFVPEHIRLFSLILLVFCIAGLTATIVSRRNSATRRTRRVMMWLYLFLINVAYGIGSNIHDGIRVNTPVYINAGIFFCLLASIIWHPSGDHKTANDDGAVGSRFILWLDDRVRSSKNRHSAGPPPRSPG